MSDVGAFPRDLALAEVMDSLGLLVCGLDGAGTIRLFNRQCEALTGIERDAAVGRSWLAVFTRGHQDDDVMGLWRRAAQGDPVEPHEMLCRMGRRLRWHFSRWDRAEPGEGVAAVDAWLWAVGFDLTREREALARARHAERMAALGHLSAGLAHEIRNPLNSAALQLAVAERALARSGAADCAPAADAVGRAVGEIERAAALLDDFLAFARPLPMTLNPVHLRDVVAKAVERVRPNAAAAMVMLELAPGDDVTIAIDPDRVEGAVVNLLTNAVDAAAGAPGGGRVTARLMGRANATAIEIWDNGPGLPSLDAPIFDPFFTTKQGGTGLGLAIVERVVSDHGGTLAVERVAGQTVFRMTLPLSAGIPA